MSRAAPNPLTPFVERQGVLVLDGGLATELEARGERLDDPLWSARLLLDAPERIAAVHEEYLRAGADCLVSAGYQATEQGLVARGLSVARARAVVRLAVDLALEVRQRFWSVPGNRVGRLRPLVAAGIGPYGAFRADGSEYTGDYDLDEDGLVEFHRGRLELLAAGDADLLAFETIPSRPEARALCRLLDAAGPGPPAWISFSCPDGRRLADGCELASTVAEVAAAERVLAVGVNCCSPAGVGDLIACIRGATDKPIVVYPNSGERYDAGGSRWIGAADAVDLAAASRLWRRAGAVLIGGCCRVGPAGIRAIRQALL